MMLKGIDKAIFVYIEDKELVTAKQISIYLKIDKAIVYKSIKVLFENCLIIKTNTNPRQYYIK